VMKKIFLVLGSLFTLVLLVIVGVAFYVLTFDPNENKEMISTRFQEATGRSLSLNGELGLTLYPWLGITLNDVAVSNAPGFSSTPLLVASHAQVRIKLLPLLNNAYEIDTIKLDGVALNLEVAGNGQNNWTLPDAEGTDGAVERDNDSTGASLNNLILGGVDIRNTSLLYDDQFADTHYEIHDLNMQIGELVYGQPLDITLSMNAASRSPALNAVVTTSGTVVYDVDNERYDLNPLNLTATLTGPTVPTGSTELTLSTALAADLDADTLSLSQLELDAFGSHLAASIEASRISTDTPAVAASLEVNGSDLALLFRILDQADLARRVSSLNSRFDIRSSLTADLRAGTLNMPALSVNLLGSTINGSVNAERFNTDTPAFKGEVTAGGPDLPLMLEVIGMLQGGSSGELTQYGRDMARVPDKVFRLETQFDTNLQDGTLSLPTLNSTLLGSTITGQVAASRINTDTPRFKGNLKAQGPDLPLMMQIIGQLQAGQEAPLNQYGRQLRTVRNKAYSFSADFDADLQSGDIQLPTLDANLLGFVLNGNLNASNLQGANDAITGQFTLRGNNLKEVLTALDQADLAEVADSLNLDVQINGNSSNMRISPLNLGLVLAGRQLGNQPQTLALNADTVVNLDTDSLQVDAFTLSGLGLNLSGNVQARNLSGEPDFSGQLTLPEFNARRLLEQLNQPAPDTADSQVLQKVAFTSRFSGTTNTLKLDNLSVTLDDSTLSGAVDLRDLASLGGQFTLNINSIDADRYMAPPVTGTRSAGGSEDPLPIEDIRKLDLQGALNIGQLTISGLQMRDIVVQLAAKDGKVALNPVKANLYEGSFNGDIRLDVTTPAPTASLSTTLTTINLEPLLKDFMDATYLTGKGNIQLSLTGSGLDVPAIKSNLNGSGSLKLEDGVLTGINVADVLGRIETMIRNRRLVQLPQAGGQTPFENFSATLAINNGVISSNDLVIGATQWDVTGRGTLVDLRTDAIDFNLVATMQPGTFTENGTDYTVGGHNLPIACTGSLEGPRCLPDIQTVFTAAVGNVVQQRLGEFLQNRLGGTQQGDTTATDNAGTAPAEQQEAPAPAPAAEQLLNKALDSLLKK